jgi:hypothetical protein
MRVAVLNLLSKCLASLATKLERASERVKRCPECGRNPYTAPPCVEGPRTGIMFHRIKVGNHYER